MGNNKKYVKTWTKTGGGHDGSRRTRERTGGDRGSYLSAFGSQRNNWARIDPWIQDGAALYRSKRMVAAVAGPQSKNAITTAPPLLGQTASD